MVNCKICKKEFKNNNGLAKHIYNKHEVSRQDYYDNYIAEISKYCECCGKQKKFRGLGEGYRTYCSVECRTKSVKPTKYWLGKKQDKSIIEKRIKNTNQKTKEQNRKQTMLEKYGVDNPSQIPTVKKQFSENRKGKSHPRVPGQQNKIIESKRKNNTLKHKSETKLKIAESIRKLYDSDNPPITISNNNNKNHKTGRYKDLYYRSSYELKFLEYCDKNDINVMSAECKEFRVPYVIDGKKRWYYPDFYLTDYDLVIEIKPSAFLSSDGVVAKINAAMLEYPYCIIDEEILSELDFFFTNLHEGLHKT